MGESITSALGCLLPLSLRAIVPVLARVRETNDRELMRRTCGAHVRERHALPNFVPGSVATRGADAGRSVTRDAHGGLDT